MEGVLRAPAMRRGICQRIDDLKELDHRTRPTVRDDDRQRVLVTRTDVQEVKVETIDLRAILSKAIKLSFEAAPVITGPPILHERPQLCERHTLRPISDRFALRPPRLCQPSLKIVESTLRSVVGKRCDAGT